MVLAVWPVGLPQPRADGYSDGAEEGFQSFATDKPTVETRWPVGSGRPRLTQFSLTCTPAQAEIIENFYDTTLIRGTQKFTWTHPRHGTVHRAQFVKGSPPKAQWKQGTPRYLVPISLRYWA